MAGLEDEIRELEDELQRTPYNKATSKHIGRVKAKIAKLRDEAVNRAMKSSGGGEGYSVKKSGDATVVLVGFPSTGKSTLLNQLTGTKSEVGAYAFTTLTVVPGALEYKGARIQILDIPGLIAGAAMGKGRGKEVIGVVRSADMIVILVDVYNQGHVDVLMKELYDAGIRINKERPDITIKKTAYGGVKVSAVGALDLDLDEIRSILSENKMMNAEILIRGNATQDELIDAMMGNRVYIPAIIAVNKVDLVDEKVKTAIEDDINRRFAMNPAMISAATGFHMEELKEEIYQSLGFMRVYLKPQSGEADLEEPLIVRTGSTVEDVCRKLHRDFVDRFRFARVWGRSVKHPGQRVGLVHRLREGDLLTIIIEH
ncbi:small GTP-binding protein [Methanolinea mesophila]|uniref:OBG GTPase family GTP-binding protein n=1 Tax=Methanolinea mesophila TaxID=547055 RepID=UPI001AE7014A|nr:GTP-binding protein [Methanolinea mesophila]MBP1927485.1 small GTP-binding protein [Methanolinea mesophila]